MTVSRKPQDKAKSLDKALWAVTSLGDDLGSLLEAATNDGQAGWKGLALTTRGPRAVTGVRPDGLTASDGEVDLSTVYELRLWQTQGLAGGLLARELRWLNGSGGVGVRVSADGDGEQCRVRAGEYLQHSPSGVEASKKMSTVEVFVCEEQFGNVVFADELMTGAWD